MKKSIIISSFAIIVTACSFTSCEDDNLQVNKSATAEVLSSPYEMLIVANKQWLSKGEGLEFRNIVDRPILGTPQAEPNFRITNIDPRDYKGKFTMYGNILIANIDPSFKESRLDIKYDVHAQPQIIVCATAPSSSRLMIMLENKKDSILNLFVQHELDRECKLLYKNHSSKVLETTEKLFDKKIFAPVDIETVTPHDSFYWATSKKRNNALNICMYTLPYTSEDDFSLNSFVQKRDSVMRLYVQGEKENQYMKTDTRDLYEKASIRNNRFVYEVRGLWYMENDAMGGPFVSYSYLDKEKKQIIVAEGFVFAPEAKKRPLIRELEAALQTIK